MSPLTASPAAAHELLSACRLLFADDSAELCRNWLRVANSDAFGLFVARGIDGGLHAAALVQALPGALGVAWAPRGDCAEAVDTATAAACGWLRSRGAKVCQAFASPSEVPDMLALERHGFRHTTQLISLRREVSSVSSLPPEPEPALEWSDQGRPLSAEFRRVLLATHEGSLDCPELTGARTPEEIVAGFDTPGPSSGLSLYRDGGEPVGVVICAEAAPETVELTYIGVAPAHRGRGVGVRMVAEQLWGACYGGYAAVSLAVDARNGPAVRLYTRLGFTEYERREVWLASWPA